MHFAALNVKNTYLFYVLCRFSRTYFRFLVLISVFERSKPAGGYREAFGKYFFSGVQQGARDMFLVVHSFGFTCTQSK